MAATREQLVQRLGEHTQEQHEILAAAEENGGKLTAEQKTRFDELEELFGADQATLSDMDAADARKALVAGRIDEVAALGGRNTQPDPLTPSPAVKVLGEGFENDPNRGFETHREFLLTAMSTAMTGQLTDPRMKSLAVGSDEGSTVSDPYGGFLLPAGFQPTLLSLDAEGDPTAGMTTAVPMTTQTLAIPARVDKNHTSSVSGGLQVYRRNETDTSAATRQEFEQVKLTATMLFGIAYASEELLERSPISFIALLEAGFSDEFAAKILKEKLFGTGAGEYTGVVNAACTVEQAKETGQAAATITKENIDNMRSRCWRYGNAVWLYNHDCLPQLRSLVQSVGTGGAPVAYFQTTPDGVSTLDGRPAFPTEFAETLGTAGDLILGNWSQYLEGTLSNQQSAESIHVRFINHERTFKFWMENDGTPWWRTALTPNQSSNTLSPFVTLAARA